MTSKEFKEKIENSPTILNRHMLLVDDDVLSIIKDLEILEIFRFYCQFFSDVKEYFRINHPEKYEKLKEWLEKNEK